jgi:uncharacterized protein (TIGR00369 family)
MDGFADWIGVTGEQADDGEARLELQADERHLNPAGTVHGGVLATLVDTTMGLAVRSADVDTPATSQLSIAYLRPANVGRLVATARVRKEGKHLLVCDADIEQDGNRVIQALATFAVVQR